MLALVLPINPLNQEPMAAYMKHNFPFLGLKAPERQALTKDLIRQSRAEATTDVLVALKYYYRQEAREYHYLALDLAVANVKRFSYAEVVSLIPLVSENAWWDSVDHWRKFFGLRIHLHRAELASLFELFYQSPDFWQRRVAITLQLMEKEKTNVALLEKAILKDQLTAEFFIQKAIGWSLRQYSKTNPDWVLEFLKAHKLSTLATKEAQKQLMKK